ncbi:hypothetical protein C8A00DRAFT_44545 [Chaetomidium leptoderma]|uniref:C2H2-type domain-containing protein n=1 Tax=Chaetomidium leptoderma TaxID=669021 RepID=A0AAN6VJQ8_9PEZI|nr:hypothetical protein C8A00DRAFT_44545 [Chaetomidium leptoderma]
MPRADLQFFLCYKTTCINISKSEGSPPMLTPDLSSNGIPLDPLAAFLRARLAAAADDDDNNSLARIFIPNRRGQASCTHAYRKITLAADMPERAPPGFGELRREILAFAEEGEEALLQVAGMQGEEEEDPASLLFVVLAEERAFPFARPFVPESDLRCEQCGAVFEAWVKMNYHRNDVHGL